MSIVCEAHSLTRNCTQRLHSQPLGKKAHTAPVSDSSSRATSGSRVLKRCCTGRSNVTQQRAARRSSQLTRSALQSVPFNPKKLTVQYQPGTLHSEFSPSLPRRYTLTHNDLTGQLLLTIGPQYSKQQLSGWYSRLLRDEILAHWQWHGPSPILHIECHVSGRETWLAPPVLRDYIFRREMPLVLNIINFAEAKFLGDNPCLANAQVMVHLSSHVPAYHASVPWGSLADSNSWQPPPRWVWSALQRAADTRDSSALPDSASSKSAASAKAPPSDEPCVIASFGLDSENEPCSPDDPAELCQQSTGSEALDRSSTFQPASGQAPSSAEDKRSATRPKAMSYRLQIGRTPSLAHLSLPLNLTASRRVAYADSLLGLIAAASTLSQL